MSVERICELGNGLELWLVEIDSLREQDVNARSMGKEAFLRLQTTIGRDARLESLPFCAQTAAGIEIVSGHHRVRAARAAGMSKLHVIVDVTGMTPSQIKAKQLAHNSIAGIDNAQLVAQIFAGIEDAEMRLEAFIDPKTVAQALEKAPVPPVAIDLDFRSILILFLPYDLRKVNEAFDAIVKEARLGSDEVWLAERETFEAFREALKRAGEEYDVRNIGCVLRRMAQIVTEALGAESPPESHVPLRKVFKCSVVPAETADKLNQIIAKVQSVFALEKHQTVETIDKLHEVVTGKKVDAERKSSEEADLHEAAVGE